MCGLYFALRGGAELQSLKRKQICLKTGSTGENYLLYEEMGSKNNPGGLNTRRVAIKQVPHFRIRVIRVEILSAYIANIYQNVHPVIMSFYKV